MLELYYRFEKWLIERLRTNFIFFLPFLSLTFGMLLCNIGIFVGSLPNGMMWLTLLMIIFCIPFLVLVYVLAEASKKAEAQNKKLDLLEECLKNLSPIYQAMETDEVYWIAKGFFLDSHEAEDVKVLLENFLGRDYQVRVLHDQINLIKHGPRSLRLVEEL